MTEAYIPRIASESRYVSVRGLRYHVRSWSHGNPRATTVVMLHGWMDVSASFQFIVDALRHGARVFAPDWRGFGLSGRSGADSYWFPDYLADLDLLLDAITGDAQVDLVGHSMGGNIAMLFAGVRPARVRRLVNLEGFGMAPTSPAGAAARYARWIDEVRRPMRLRSYASLAAVAARLRDNNPRLPLDRASFLATHWSAERDGEYVLLADSAHKRVNPVLYRVEETTSVWRAIEAPVLLVRGDDADRSRRFFLDPAYAERLGAIAHLLQASVPDAGHMLHHDQPGRVAELVEGFLA